MNKVVSKCMMACFFIFFAIQLNAIAEGIDSTENSSHKNSFAQQLSDKPPLDLFFALGQSNMAGRAPIIPEVMDTIEDVLLFDDHNSWSPAVNPLNKYSNIRKELSMQQVGPSYSFVKTLATYVDQSIGLVVNARGGTSVAELANGDYRDSIFVRLREARKSGEVKAILWHQGEADNSKTDVYMNELGLFVSELRTEFGDAYFVAGQMGGWILEGQTFPRYQMINNTISSIGEHIPNSDYVTNEDLGHKGDNTHFNLESQILLGQRYAQKVLKAVYSIDISIIDVDLKGDGYAVFGKDTVTEDLSWSYTTLKGEDRFIKIFPEPGKVITSLVINGLEVKRITGAESYSYPVTTSGNQKLKIELNSGFPETVQEKRSEEIRWSDIMLPNPVKDIMSFKTEGTIGNIEIFIL